tara:strand:+ start:10 stop:1140 length:1131 start_codon:yes stop_codon:yes gene_type:complete
MAGLSILSAVPVFGWISAGLKQGAKFVTKGVVESAELYFNHRKKFEKLLAFVSHKLKIAPKTTRKILKSVDDFFDAPNPKVIRSVVDKSKLSKPARKALRKKANDYMRKDSVKRLFDPKGYAIKGFSGKTLRSILAYSGKATRGSGKLVGLLNLLVSKQWLQLITKKAPSLSITKLLAVNIRLNGSIVFRVHRNLSREVENDTNLVGALELATEAAATYAGSIVKKIENVTKKIEEYKAKNNGEISFKEVYKIVTEEFGDLIDQKTKDSLSKMLSDFGSGSIPHISSAVFGNEIGKAADDYSFITKHFGPGAAATTAKGAANAGSKIKSKKFSANRTLDQRSGFNESYHYDIIKEKNLKLNKLLMESYESETKKTS